MLSVQAAHELVASRLGDSARARHSILVSHAMALLARLLGGDEDLWRVVGLCHDLDYFETAGDPSRHGLLAAQWLARGLPAAALDAIKAHDHRTGVRADTDLADALKLADALAVADGRIGRARMVALRDPDGEANLRALTTDRPYLPEMIVAISRKHGIGFGQLAALFETAPPQ